MKKEFLESLGLSKEAIDTIMAENGKDVEAEKAKAAAKEGELVKANETITNLQATIRQYDGKDPVKLQSDLTALQKKYDDDIKTEQAKATNIQKEFMLKDALRDIGAVDPDYLIFKTGGVEKFAFAADGKPVGLEDTVKDFRQSAPHLFGENKPAPVSTGLSHQGNKEESTSGNDAANAAFRSLLGKE